MGEGLVIAGAVLLAFVLIGVFAPAEETSNGTGVARSAASVPAALTQWSGRGMLVPKIAIKEDLLMVTFAQASAWSIRVVGKRAAWLVAAAVSLGVTVYKLNQTYDGFFTDALWTPWTLWLVLVNMAFTLALIFVLRLGLKPQREVWFAVVVALSFQALVNSDFDTGLVGAEASTKAESLQTVNLGFWYEPWAKQLTRNIEDPVRVAMRDEENALVAAYASSSGLAALADRFLDDLARTKLVPPDKKPAVEETIKRIVADSVTQVGKRVRLLGEKTYENFGRPTVQRYIREGRAS